MVVLRNVALGHLGLEVDLDVEVLRLAIVDCVSRGGYELDVSAWFGNIREQVTVGLANTAQLVIHGFVEEEAVGGSVLEA